VHACSIQSCTSNAVSFTVLASGSSTGCLADSTAAGHLCSIPVATWIGLAKGTLRTSSSMSTAQLVGDRPSADVRVSALSALSQR
jgi:hypothetical protein